MFYHSVNWNQIGKNHIYLEVFFFMVNIQLLHLLCDIASVRSPKNRPVYKELHKSVNQGWSNNHRQTAKANGSMLFANIRRYWPVFFNLADT